MTLGTLTLVAIIVVLVAAQLPIPRSRGASTQPPDAADPADKENTSASS